MNCRSLYPAAPPSSYYPKAGTALSEKYPPPHQREIYERYREGFRDLPVRMNPYDESCSRPNFYRHLIIRRQAQPSPKNIRPHIKDFLFLNISITLRPSVPSCRNKPMAPVHRLHMLCMKKIVRFLTVLGAASFILGFIVSIFEKKKEKTGQERGERHIFCGPYETHFKRPMDFRKISAPTSRTSSSLI